MILHFFFLYINLYHAFGRLIIIIIDNIILINTFEFSSSLTTYVFLFLGKQKLQNSLKQGMCKVCCT